MRTALRPDWRFVVSHRHGRSDSLLHARGMSHRTFQAERLEVERHFITRILIHFRPTLNIVSMESLRKA